MSQPSRRQHGSNAYPPAQKASSSRGDHAHASSSRGACRTCDAINYPKPGSSVTLTQTFVGHGPTFLDVVAPNQPSSGYRAGQQAYQEARGHISVAEFNAELAQAFLYFQQRFGLPTTYYLTPIQSYTDTTNFTAQDLEAANTLGLPLSTITYFDTNQVKQTWGYYRPEVYCQNLRVACAKVGDKCAGEAKFRKVLMAEHVIFIAPQGENLQGIQSVGNPTSTIVVNQATPSEYVPVIDGQAVPPRVFPQYFGSTPAQWPMFPLLSSAMYGFATLVSGHSDNLKTTDIAYRSLYPGFLNLSSSNQFRTVPPPGQYQTSFTCSFPVQVSSCELGSGDFEGLSLIQRCHDVRGSSVTDPLAPEQPDIPFDVLFDPNGAYVIVTQSATFVFPRCVDVSA